jgi:hypothetical protein
LDPLVRCTDPNTGWNPTQEELKPYEMALDPELLDQVENLLRDLDMPPVKVSVRNIHLLSPVVKSG